MVIGELPIERSIASSGYRPLLNRSGEGLVSSISRFYGIVVSMYSNDHPPPHFHVYAGRIGHPGVQAARFSIETGAMTEGKLPRAKLPNLTSWWEEHRDALAVDWERAQLGQHPIGR
jgi:hypothetical protein